MLNNQQGCPETAGDTDPTLPPHPARPAGLPILPTSYDVSSKIKLNKTYLSYSISK